ncbi:MAG: hypothetical protein L0Z47_01790 [Actinobacteria bacterium]|nr:hypothetical protein [Actinomycetota bacterium]
MRKRTLAALVSSLLIVSACTSDGTADTEAPETTTEAATTQPEATTTTAPPATTTTIAEGEANDHGGGAADPADISAAALANAPFQDVAMAEAAGYASTMGDLGCFENSGLGGMGLHYLNGTLMDGALDITTPEALVYELDASGGIAGLVAHEYIVPVDAWTDESAPNLFGVDLHQHPTLPLWVLHVWLWKDNPSGIFEDWNPKVRMCPEGVPVFGEDTP